MHLRLGGPRTPPGRRPPGRTRNARPRSREDAGEQELRRGGQDERAEPHGKPQREAGGRADAPYDSPMQQIARHISAMSRSCRRSGVLHSACTSAGSRRSPSWRRAPGFQPGNPPGALRHAGRAVRAALRPAPSPHPGRPRRRRAHRGRRRGRRPRDAAGRGPARGTPRPLPHRRRTGRRAGLRAAHAGGRRARAADLGARPRRPHLRARRTPVRDYVAYPGDLPHTFEAPAPHARAVLVTEHS